MRPVSVQFDPVSAEIWGQVRSSKASGIVKSTPVKLFTTRIVAPRGLYTNETVSLNAANSMTNVIIEVQKLGLGGSLTADMFIKHRGMTYQVKGSLPIALWDKEVIRYHCVVCNDPSHP